MNGKAPPKEHCGARQSDIADHEDARQRRHRATTSSLGPYMDHRGSPHKYRYTSKRRAEKGKHMDLGGKEIGRGGKEIGRAGKEIGRWGGGRVR